MAREEVRSKAAERGRPRRLAALGASAEQLERLQGFGDALDALVRALRKGDSLAAGYAHRAHRAWSELPGCRIDFGPTEIRAGSRAVLAASSDRGRFILPAYYAGLRALALHPLSSEDDLIELGQWLATLESTQASLQAFADWLWRGGALGFEVAQVEGLHRLGEGLIRNIPSAELWAARSTRAVEIWNDMAWKAGERVSRATVDQRFAAPLALIERRAAAGELDLSDDEAAGLRKLADDAACWAGAEVALLRAQPELRAALSAAHVGRVFAAIVEHAEPFDLAVLGLLADLGCDVRDDSHANAEGASTRVLALSFTLRLLACDARGALDPAVIDAIGPSLRVGIVNALCEHGETHAAGPSLLSALAQRWGVALLFATVEPLELGPFIGTAITRAAIDAGVAPAQLMGWVERLPCYSGFHALAGAAALLPFARDYVQRALADEPATASANMPVLIASDPAAAQLSGELLLACGARDLPEPYLEPCLAALVERKLGRPFVLPLFRSKQASITARRVALLALSGDERLLTEALHGVDATKEPREIRELVEELRWKEPK